MSSDESDVEWEEVEALPETSLQQNGLVGRETNIAIQLPVKVGHSYIIFNDIISTRY